MSVGDPLFHTIIEAAREVHHLLGGPGLLETVYETALCHELLLRKVLTKRQIQIPVMYKDAHVRDPLFMDILVEDKLIVEVKATGKDYPLYLVQLHTHLRLFGCSLGLLINFGKHNLEEGIVKVVI